MGNRWKRLQTQTTAAWCAAARRTGFQLGRVALLSVLCTSNCLSSLNTGTFGFFRYGGAFPAENDPPLPLQLFPPVSDRESNVYMLYGSQSNNGKSEADISKAIGGSQIACDPMYLYQIKVSGDTTGTRGWVGYAQGRQWFWLGDALISVSGTTGDCFPVHNTDPITHEPIQYRAVIPWIRDTPSHTTVVALTSPLNSIPTQAVIELNDNLLLDSHNFSHSNASQVKVLGVGADPDNDVGFVLLNYSLTNGGRTYTEAHFFDADANTVAISPIQNAENIAENGVQGYLQSLDGQLVVGLDNNRKLIVFDRSGGHANIVAPKGIKPVGVHRWGKTLWLVGTSLNDQHPMVAPINPDGSVGEVTLWDASEKAAANLHQTIKVTYDRSLPSYIVPWDNPHNAIGLFPFVTPHSPFPYADNTTLWVVAGPAFKTNTLLHYQVAWAPVGISYP